MPKCTLPQHKVIQEGGTKLEITNTAADRWRCEMSESVDLFKVFETSCELRQVLHGLALEHIEVGKVNVSKQCNRINH